MSQPHSTQAAEVVHALGVNPEKGLTYQEAAARLNKYGNNTLIEEIEIHFLGILREEITEPMILLLIAVFAHWSGE